MKRRLAALLLGIALLGTSAQAVTVTLDGSPLELGDAPIYENTAYVPLRGLMEILYPDAAVTWEDGAARVTRESFSLTAVPQESALTCDGVRTELPLPVRLEEGRTLVPVRPLAALLGLDVSWDRESRTVCLSHRSEPAYSDHDLYWLSRIISAESQGECWEGKIAVGNVVLNRVRSSEFPDTIYDVIFDARWGGQFAPVRNGTIYHEPTEESVRAARACLQGENTAGDSLYFIAPSLTNNHWTMQNRTYVTTIGVHWFYE